MKRKIAMLLVGVAVISLLMGGTAYAYFSNTESSENNNFTAGTLNLVVNGVDPWDSTTFNVNNVEPDQSGVATMTVQNTGNVGGTLSFNIEDLIETGGTYPEPEQETAGANNADLGKTIRISLWIDANNNGRLDGAEVEMYNNTLFAAASAGPWNIGALNGGATNYVSMLWMVPASAGNEIMGDTCQFTLEFVLTQS